jgi:transcriptional regulator with PAS, ATPase and Fis domain
MGLFEYADRGTIFLDEIGDMPIATQAKLLRTLQNQEVLRVGSLSPRKVDVHVVAATNQDLRAAIGDKRFREDLFYRLSMVEIRVPALAERKEDLPLLTKYFLDKFSSQFRKDIRGLTQRAQVAIARHNWPGNVRELENVLGHGAMMAMAETIDMQDLPDYLRSPQRAFGRRRRCEECGRGHVCRSRKAFDYRGVGAGERQSVTGGARSAAGQGRAQVQDAEARATISAQPDAAVGLFPKSAQALTSHERAESRGRYS